MIREYKLDKDSLVYQHKEYLLTKDGSDVINHPTGIAYHGACTVFIGNSIRLSEAGTKWKAMIYCVNWQGFAAPVLAGLLHSYFEIADFILSYLSLPINFKTVK